MEDWIFPVVLGAIAILIWIIVGISKKKKESKERAEKEQREDEKKRRCELWRQRILSNETVGAWIEEVVQICAQRIQDKPHLNQTIELIALPQTFMVGCNFQVKYLVNMRDTIPANKTPPEFYFARNFTKSDLPELKKDEQNPFAKAFTLLVMEELKKLGIETKSGHMVYWLRSDGESETDEEKATWIYTIEYQRRTSDKSW